MYKFLQHLGRSLMLPVAVLPAAAIIVGIGHTLDALNILPQAALFFYKCWDHYIRAIRYIICYWCSYRYG